MTWKTISIPAEMLEAINNYLKTDGTYSSASDFVRSAVREHFNRIRALQQAAREVEVPADG